MYSRRAREGGCERNQTKANYCAAHGLEIWATPSAGPDLVPSCLRAFVPACLAWQYSTYQVQRALLEKSDHPRYSTPAGTLA